MSVDGSADLDERVVDTDHYLFSMLFCYYKEVQVEKVTFVIYLN